VGSLELVVFTKIIQFQNLHLVCGTQEIGSRKGNSEDVDVLDVEADVPDAPDAEAAEEDAPDAPDAPDAEAAKEDAEAAKEDAPDVPDAEADGLDTAPPKTKSKLAVS